MLRAILFTAMVFGLPTAALCDTITFDLALDKTVYLPGELVNWSVSVSAANFSANNFGAAVISFDLTEDRGEVLSAAGIAAPFQDYAFISGGIAGTGSLLNAGASLFSYNSAAIELTSTSAGPTLLASGSFVANQLGAHNLTLTSAVADNSYFTSITVGAANYATVFGDNAAFSVAAAVPEPGTVAFLSFVLGAAILRRRRMTAR